MTYSDSIVSPRPAVSVKVGDKMQFHRGMFGMWPCTVKRIRQSTKRHTFGSKRVWVADVTFTRRNGTFGKAVVQLEHLEPLPAAKTLMEVFAEEVTTTSHSTLDTKTETE